ncbi:MAG: 8-amino-7-oxononanoate synthase [Terriglobales bacterium]
MDATELSRACAEELAALAVAGRRRELRPPSGRDFCSNDYLGLARHPRVRAALAAALAPAATSTPADGLPLGGGSSRLIRGEDPRWGALEARFAGFCGAAAALYFPSGYAANLSLLTVLARRGDVIFSDRLNHASLIDGMRLSGAERVRLPHLDLAAYEAAFRRSPAKAGQRRLAVVESVYSMEGDLAPLAELAALCAGHQVALVVDEAHATGLFGPDGAGFVAAAGWPAPVVAVVHTCGKAWGAAGALVVGPAWLKDLLINRARPFIYTTAPPPLMAVQLEAAMDTATAEPWRREQVRAHARELRRHLAAAGLIPERAGAAAESPIIPVVVGADRRAVAVSQRLAAAGFDVRAIRPPTVPEGTARLRLTVHAEHSSEELAALAAALRAAVTAEAAA